MKLRLIACLAVVASVAFPALAAPLSPVKAAELSARLYDAGAAAQDPLLVLAAARLRKQINPEPTNRQAEGSAASEGAPLGWEDMLATATELAGDDEALLALIEDARAETTKGVITGPVYNIGNVAAGGTDRYAKVDFKGGEYAEVYVEAKSSTDLNLAVYDDQGRLVCTDNDISHIAYCGWRPSENGGYSFAVVNKSGSGTAYALMTN